MTSPEGRLRCGRPSAFVPAILPPPINSNFGCLSDSILPLYPLQPFLVEPSDPPLRMCFSASLSFRFILLPRFRASLVSSYPCFERIFLIFFFLWHMPYFVFHRQPSSFNLSTIDFPHRTSRTCRSNSVVLSLLCATD